MVKQAGDYHQHITIISSMVKHHSGLPSNPDKFNCDGKSHPAIPSNQQNQNSDGKASWRLPSAHHNYLRDGKTTLNLPLQQIHFIQTSYQYHFMQIDNSCFLLFPAEE
jgi:hypothetical protein